MEIGWFETKVGVDIANGLTRFAFSCRADLCWERDDGPAQAGPFRREGTIFSFLPEHEALQLALFCQGAWADEETLRLSGTTARNQFDIDWRARRLPDGSTQIIIEHRDQIALDADDEDRIIDQVVYVFEPDEARAFADMIFECHPGFCPLHDSRTLFTIALRKFLERFERPLFA